MACEPDGFGDLPAGAIVLARPGGCFRRQQVLSAQEAGAAGFLAGYPAAEAGAVLRPTLIHPGMLSIPAAGVTRPVGDALAAAAASNGTVHLVTNATTTPAATRSIIAELPGGDPGLVVMLGAHLDSVVDGPGINDNGSGVAALLELARALGGSTPRATIRLAFWSAEELGLHGSSHYVAGLSNEERDAILVYLNADMVASPNGFAGVYDEHGVAGSESVRDLLSAAVTRAGGTPVVLDVGGGSDHYVFGQAGIRTGGVISGDSELVSDEQAAASGANAGQPADPCYHQPCDDGTAIDTALAAILTSALADVALQVANDPSLVAP
jgi:Zn-dependent M28 family amino/carboxypeptidase